MGDVNREAPTFRGVFCDIRERYSKIGVSFAFLERYIKMKAYENVLEVWD